MDRQRYLFYHQNEGECPSQSINESDLPEDKDHEILKEETITLTYTVNGEKQALKLRKIAYWDDENSKLLVFLTTSLDQEASTIAGIYKLRWHIELLFK